MKWSCHLRSKLYNKAIEEIISETSKFEKLSEDPTLKRFTTTFFTYVETKNFSNEI